MAAAAPSPLASSVEKTNGAKLSRLLIDGGTTVLRNVFDHYHPPANLAADLNANYLTLNNLYKKKVLHQSQWDKLFPPGGATPDSKRFDITLLFLLLTNICGLSPPLSGWHKPPPSSDTSLEANLARVKLYRNELYGHVTSTGVITAVFNVKWQEISAVLVALGLNPAEVVRLKAAPCGEDYISAVIDWVKSDEDIKAQLREVLDTQQEARQMQEADHRTLQDTHKVAEKVLKTQQEELQKQQQERQIREEDHRTLQDTKKAVEDVRQIHQDTQKIVEEILKTQQEEHQKQQKAQQIKEEDHRTLQDTHKAVEGVMQIHQDTNQQVKTILKTQQEVRHTQLEDHEIFQDNKSTLEEVRQTVEGAAKTQEERFKAVEANLQEIRQSFSSLKEERNRESQTDEVLYSLAKSEFKGDIEYHVGRFQEGTREWVFTKVQNWLDDRNCPNRVMVISANAGMGKSVISAVICKRMQEGGRLSGSHFCQHNNARYRNPQLMLQSLACHLCHVLPEYKQALVNQLIGNLGEDLNNMGAEELFALLFKEPLSNVADPGRNMLMVIDGLDESEYQARNELLDVIVNHFCKLPCWIRFLCTTRPEKKIAEALKQLKPFQLEPNEEENFQDIKLFLEKKTQYLMKPENKSAWVEKLAEKSEGLMLYAYFLVSFIEENVSVLDQGDFDGSLPLAISSVYHSYFKRLENELMKEHGIKEENFLNLLCAFSASREPLPVDFVSKVLVPNANSLIVRRKLLKAIGSVSSLLPIRDGCLHVIHKSVKDWLTDTSCYGEHDFSVDEEEGHCILANLCFDELDNLKEKGVHDAQYSPTVKYSLQHGVRHMLQLKEAMRPGRCSLEECVQEYVIDLEILYAKVCVDTSMAAEDILWLERHEISQLLSGVSKRLLTTLKFLLRKYFSTFENHPHVFFQIVLNEGGTYLSAEASRKLQKKYLELPYMELVHKEMEQGAVLARFECSSQVACFDVSPQSEYMVCECEDGTIQMWSLHTGKLVWTRPVLVKKFHFGNGAYRMPLSSSGALSFYRSVVFHPSASIVIPGVLSHAYTFDGDLKPLFPESNCSFTVCSISGDKTRMLTDCSDNAKCIMMWSLKNGSEMTRTTRNADVLSFAWSPHGRLLAISHSTGSISIVDVMDGFSTLAETDIEERCGTMKFTPDCQSLWCFGGSHLLNHLYCLKINMAENPNRTLDIVGGSYEAWKFESHSDAGFLLGDPLSSVNREFDFVLNEETVLRGSPGDTSINMERITDPPKTFKETELEYILKIVFSLNGDSVYNVVRDEGKPTFSAWDVSSGKLVGRITPSSNSLVGCHLVPVKQGVLLTTKSGPLELWNFNLSKCDRQWTNVYGIRKMMPISEERVACETEDKVIILDTTSGEIVSTIPTSHKSFIACNSKYQMLHENRTYDDGDFYYEVYLSDVGSINLPFDTSVSFAVFSPDGGLIVVICPESKRFPLTACFIDAVSCETLHAFGRSEIYDCKFISDEECVISCLAFSGGYCLQLFNVKSGDLLSVINLAMKANCLAACPRKRLLAIAQSYCNPRFELIQVHLPHYKDSRKSKWTSNIGDHKEVQFWGRKKVCSCLVPYYIRRLGGFLHFKC